MDHLCVQFIDDLAPILCYNTSCVIGCLDRLCNQQLQNGVSNFNSRNRSNLAVIVICWCYLHYITTNDVQAFQSG